MKNVHDEILSLSKPNAHIVEINFHENDSDMFTAIEWGKQKCKYRYGGIHKFSMYETHTE